MFHDFRFYSSLFYFQLYSYFLPCTKTIHSLIFSERELTFTLAKCYCPSVCLSSVTLVRHTQAVEIFGSVSTAFATEAIRWHPQKFYGDCPRGTPPPWELNTRGSQIAILDLSKAISRKRCKIGSKLVLITNRKLHMSFWLVPKSVTLNDLERHNGRYFALFQRIRVPSGRTA